MAKLGRPTKYRPEYCKMLIEHMSKGLSFESFGAVIDVAVSNLYMWLEKHTDFQEAATHAKNKCLLFWEQKGIDGLQDRTVRNKDGSTETVRMNPVTWKFNMQNRFKWTDKKEVDQTISGEVTHQIEKLDVKQLREAVKKDFVLDSDVIEVKQLESSEKEEEEK